MQVVQTVAIGRTLDAQLVQAVAARGGTYTSHAVADGAGVAIVVVSIVCLALAIGFSVPRLRAGRIAFWVPLASAAVWLVLVGAFLVAAMVVDPGAIATIPRA